jgi:hypothetical protein
MRRSIFTVTAGLIVASALLGGSCGLLALLPIPVRHLLRPTGDDGFITAGDLAPWAFACGASLGAVLGPTLAWTLLRRVPLWRLLLEPAVGTIAGAFLGWAVADNWWLRGIPTILTFAFTGTIAASLRLRFATHERAQPDIDVSAI